MTDGWPELGTARWLDTATTLHLWSQVVGKTRLALEPSMNHWWQVPLYVSARGLATPVLYDGDQAFDIELDLVLHALRVRDGTGRELSFPLGEMTVAAFYRKTMETLASIGVVPDIWPRAVEIPTIIDLDRDVEHHSYDPVWARSFATALRRADAALKGFRGRFLGKASPVHFFWGGFDLATTRFSGRTAPKHPGGIPNCADRVMVEAYSHEVSSAGFWLGNAESPHAAFYAYAYPEPAGFAEATVRPSAAYYDKTFREFVLPYDAVRASPDPEREIDAFLTTTYEAAADLGHWDRRALERQGTA